jgi:hypothetical protein
MGSDLYMMTNTWTTYAPAGESLRLAELTPAERAELVVDLTHASKAFPAKHGGACPMTGVHFRAGDEIRAITQGRLAGRFVPNETLSRLYMTLAGDDVTSYAPYNGREDGDAEELFELMVDGGHEVVVCDKYGRRSTWVASHREQRVEAKGSYSPCTLKQFRQRIRGGVLVVVRSARRTVRTK